MRHKLILAALIAAFTVGASTMTEAQWVRTAELDSPHPTPTVLTLEENNGLLEAGVLSDCTYGSSTYGTTNNGISWFATGSGLSIWNTTYSIMPFGGNLFCESASECGKVAPSGLFRSTDNGISYVKSDSGIPPGALGEGNTTRGATNLLASFGNTLFVLGTGIFRSTDTGRSWMAADTGLVFWSFYHEVDALVASDGNLFASAGNYSDDRFIDGAIYKSTDSGQSWAKTPGSPGFPVFILASTGQRIFAVKFFTYAQPPPGFYTSSDQGSSWQLVNCPIIPNALVVSGAKLFAAGSEGNVGFAGDGVYYSNDTGITWTLASAGTSLGSITSLLLTNDYLFAGTSDSGVWRRPLSDFDKLGVTNSENISTLVSLNSFPDPSTSNTVLSFDLPQGSTITLTITDAAGRETTLLKSAWMDAGSHEVAWDANNYPSGVYLCRLSTGGESVTQRLIVLH